MRQKFEKWLKKIKLYQWIMYTLPMFRYMYYLKKCKIDKNAILLESHYGKKINGNVFYLVKELSLNRDYKDYKIYISCTEINKNNFKKIFEKYGITNINFVVFSTNEYMRVLASAKYLINDGTFNSFFIKRKGQVYLNIWQATPFNVLGRYGISNMQKNLACADYIVCPNTFTKKIIEEEYMLENIVNGKVLLSGQPKNTAFFDEKRKEKIRSELELNEKIVYAYIPVKRGKKKKSDDKGDVYIAYYIYELDKKLSEDEVLYVKLNPDVAKNINFKECSHVKKFPAQYEIYDFLSCADCFITDYSGIFYDFPITGGKNVLFSFDENSYLREHKTYLNFSELPFPKVKTVDELICELRAPKNYEDSIFIKEYCSYNCAESTKMILDCVLLGKKAGNLVETEIAKNEKKNIVVYVDGNEKNVKEDIDKLLKKVDVRDCNYFIAFNSKKEKRYKSIIDKLPEEVKYFPVSGVFNLGIFKKIIWTFFKKGVLPINILMKLFDKEWEYEIQRIFGGVKFDEAINLNGSGPKMLLLFSKFDCKRILYVSGRARSKDRLYKSVLKYVYSKYDNVFDLG